MADRDETESSVLKRGDGVRQRAQNLAALLREEKALTAKLKAASEEGSDAHFGFALLLLVASRCSRGTGGAHVFA